MTRPDGAGGWGAGIRSGWRSLARWHPPSWRWLRGEWQPITIVILMIVGVGILLRLAGLGQAPLSEPEAIALIQATGEAADYIPPGPQPAPLSRYQALFDLPNVDNGRMALSAVGKVLGDLRAEGVPPLTALGQHLSLQLFGTSVGAQRLWGAVGGIATIAAGYGLGRSLLGSRRGGGMLAALMAIHPLLLGRSLVASGDGWVMLASTLGIWGTVGRWPGATLSLVLGLGLASDYRLAIGVVALGILGIQGGQARRLGVAGLGAIALIAPWYLWTLAGLPQTGRAPTPLLAKLPSAANLFPTLLAHLVPPIPLDQRLGAIAQTVAGLGVGPTAVPAGRGIWVAGGMVLILGLGLVGWGRSRRSRPPQPAALPWPRVVRVGVIAGGIPLLAAALVAALGGEPDWTLGAIALPGLLCPVAAGLCHWTRQGREVWVVALLALYVAIDAGLSPPLTANLDPVVAAVERVSPRPTLVLLDSRDRGTILRLAYYLPSLNLIHLLVWDPQQMPPRLDPILTDPRIEYVRLLWIDHGRSNHRGAIAPGAVPKRAHLQAEIDQYFQLVATEVITDGPPPQHYTLRVYARSPAI